MEEELVPDLPAEVLYHIAEYLPRRSVLEFARASRATLGLLAPVLPQMAASAAVIIATELVGIVVYVSTGVCIPAYTLGVAGLGLIVMGYVLTNAVVGNARIAHLGSAPLRLALPPEAPLLPRILPALAGRERLARRLAAHAAVLDRIADVRGAGARLLGAPVTAGLARRLLAGGLTAGFAAWTVLRATGVAVTMQCVCPSQGAAYTPWPQPVGQPAAAEVVDVVREVVCVKEVALRVVEEMAVVEVVGDERVVLAGLVVVDAEEEETEEVAEVAEVEDDEAVEEGEALVVGH
ncbi:hypothetical protein DFJ74DRAFT_712619 [Hyaloraphidium curvatum]|nr:hypothetical protein DFJ74DRAFT_712619 [Hyaloraphidium curvatum]